MVVWFVVLLGIFITFLLLSKESEKREKVIEELQVALDEVKTLSGLVPICSSCKKIRDDTGFWNQIELYIEKHSAAQFSHAICPDCIKKLYPEQYQKMKMAGKI